MRCGIWVRWSTVVVSSALAVAGCRRPVAAAAAGPVRPTAATQPEVVGGGTFRDEAAAVELTYPAGWVTKKSPDYLWMAVPTTGLPAGVSLSLEVPPLPPHVPGMIPIGLVKNGYLDDLKTGKSTFASSETTPTIPSAKARLVHSTWSDGQGQSKFETALLLVHGDRVYILRANGSAADEPRVAPAFDEVSRALKWIK